MAAVAAATPSFAPESVLKKRKFAADLTKKARVMRKGEKKAAATRRAGMIKRAGEYVDEYKKAEAELVAKRRLARAKGDFFVEPEAKLALVVRIRGINGVSPKVRKILQLLRLRQIFNATFVRINTATLQMLQLVKPYIAWGCVARSPPGMTAHTTHAHLARPLRPAPSARAATPT